MTTPYNPLQTTILERRTVHDYTLEPLPEGALERALECALRAPNHKLTNPWRFTRLGAKARATLTTLALDIKCPERANPKRVETIRTKFTNPPELIVVSQLRNPDDPFRQKEDYAAVACAIQNMSLSLWSEGIGSKWSSGGVTQDARTYELAHIPDNEEIVGFVWAGLAQKIPNPPRAPLDAVLRETD